MEYCFNVIPYHCYFAHKEFSLCSSGSVFGSYQVFSEHVSATISGEEKHSNVWKRELSNSGHIFLWVPTSEDVVETFNEIIQNHWFC